MTIVARIPATVGLAFSLLTSLSADTLYLRDGRVVNGTFISGTSREIRFNTDAGRTQTFDLNQVKNIDFGQGATGQSSSGVFNPSDRPRDDQSRTYDRSREEQNRLDRDVSRNRSASAVSPIPVGTVVTVRMIDPIDSDANSAGQTFRASVDDPIIVDGRTIADRGADATVRLARVQQSGRISGNEEVTLVLQDIRANGRTYPVNSTDAQVAAKSRGSQSAKVIGGTAVVGAIIGAIAGGGKGAAIGAASGAGAGTAVQAIRGQRVQVPAESKLDFTITDSPSSR